MIKIVVRSLEGEEYGRPDVVEITEKGIGTKSYPQNGRRHSREFVVIATRQYIEDGKNYTVIFKK